MKQEKPTSVEAYINAFQKPTQVLLQQIRTIIRKAVPDAEEVISYSIPAYKQEGMLVYFAGYEHHIGFYPTASGIRAFQKEIAGYKHSKGAVQFPLGKPLPVALITKIVKFKLKENQDKSKAKKKARKRA